MTDAKIPAEPANPGAPANADQATDVQRILLDQLAAAPACYVTDFLMHIFSDGTARLAMLEILGPNYRMNRGVFRFTVEALERLHRDTGELVKQYRAAQDLLARSDVDEHGDTTRSNVGEQGDTTRSKRMLN